MQTDSLVGEQHRAQSFEVVVGQPEALAEISIIPP